MKLNYSLILLTVAIGVSTVCIASAATYNMKNLGTLGGSSSEAKAISSNGYIAGVSSTSSGQSHAFLWQSGVMKDLGTLGGNLSIACGVNSKGEVVGWSTNSPTGSVPHAFIWRNGKMEDLGTLTGQETMANSINDNGQIVGYSVASRGFPIAVHPTLWENGPIQDLGAIFGGNSGATCINDTGDIAGWGLGGGFILHEGVVSSLGNLPNGREKCFINDINNNCWVVGRGGDSYGNKKPVIWRDGAIEDLGSHGGTNGEAFAINNLGLVVGGSANVGAGPSHAFVWENGVMSELEGFQNESCAYGINDNGWIVGMADGKAVMWAPVPEPSSILALVGGIVGFGGFALKRNRNQK